jgi:flagellar hook-associated protein 3 FlgL
MGVSPINVSRISQNLRAFNLLNTVRSGQVDMFRTQNRLATGLRFATPSEDPVRAADAIKLDRYTDILSQVEQNLLRVNETLRAGEAAVQEAADLVMEAHTLALSMASDAQSPGERESVRIVIDSILDQLVTVGNRQHLDLHLFSGTYGDDLPFELGAGGVLYRGDDGSLQTIVDSDLSQDTFTVSGMEVFNAVSDGVQGFVDLDPALTRDTRLIDLNGATSNGVSLGRIGVSDGRAQVEIDLTGADTVGDLLDILNHRLPSTLSAQLTTTGINVLSHAVGPATITITDTGGGNAALDLGIHRDTPVAAVVGADLDPKLTAQTTLDDLNLGAGIDLGHGLTIRNGSDLAVVTFADANTLEDVLNQINHADIGVLAQIGDDRQSIEVRNRISGTDLRIEENGGQVASDLGIRSMHAGTDLAGLNDGRGVDSVDGDDIRITTANGTTIDLDVNDLSLDTATLQDVIDLLNTRGGGAITAALANTGNGITITDNTVGGATLAIERLNLSPAIDGLGLDVAAVGGVLTGTDVNPVKVHSPFNALIELRQALANDDSEGISAAGRQLRASLDHTQDIQGHLAAKAAIMLQRADRIDNERTAARILQSDLRDADMTETIVRFQQVQTALQANLATAARVMNLSLLDYLR